MELQTYLSKTIVFVMIARFYHKFMVMHKYRDAQIMYHILNPVQSLKCADINLSVKIQIQLIHSIFK